MADKRYLITGGCGFIGSNFTHHLMRVQPDSEIVVADCLTYAGSIENLQPLVREKRVTLERVDISDRQSLAILLKQRFNLVINFAAETHVDRSLYEPEKFVRTNVLGTENLLTLCRESNSPLLQISTDEVYGPLGDSGYFDENSPLNPTSPYAASKAAADLLVLAAIKTFRQNALIVRTCNNYGPRQFPEKLIPFFIYLAQKGKPLMLYGDGQQRRTWLHVDDFCSALFRLISDFSSGEVYNIGSQTEVANLEVAKRIALAFAGVEIEHITDRPAHDRRYRIDSTKFASRYGPVPERDFLFGLQETIKWYNDLPATFERLNNRESKEFRELHYHKRV